MPLAHKMAQDGTRWYKMVQVPVDPEFVIGIHEIHVSKAIINVYLYDSICIHFALGSLTHAIPCSLGSIFRRNKQGAGKC
jgi:hypothetical protein